MTSGVDFTNILHKTFTSVDPKSAKKDSQVISHFGLLESMRIKAAWKHVGEIEPSNIFYGKGNNVDWTKVEKRFGQTSAGGTNIYKMVVLPLAGGA